jgi:hypothetical protein
MAVERVRADHLPKSPIRQTGARIKIVAYRDRVNAGPAVARIKAKDVEPATAQAAG